MTREIKFRAWDKKDKIMDGPFSINTILDQKLPGEWFSGNGDFKKREDLTFMQSTDLLDKNGKEIYEGDIVEKYFSDDPSFRINSCNPYKVIFFNAKFMVWKDYPENSGRAGVMSYYDLCQIKQRNIEVIGNIYENPQLLKEEA